MSLTYISNHYQWKQLCSQALAGKVVGGGKPLLYTHLIVNWREAGIWKLKSCSIHRSNPDDWTLSLIFPSESFCSQKESHLTVFTLDIPSELESAWSPTMCLATFENVVIEDWEWILTRRSQRLASWVCGNGGWDFEILTSVASKTMIQWCINVKSQIHPQWPSASPIFTKVLLLLVPAALLPGMWSVLFVFAGYVPKHR